MRLRGLDAADTDLSTGEVRLHEAPTKEETLHGETKQLIFGQPGTLPATSLCLQLPSEALFEEVRQ